MPRMQALCFCEGSDDCSSGLLARWSWPESAEAPATQLPLTLRYGAVNGPPSVSGPARPQAPGPGHYFLLDTDAAWQPADSIPESEPARILGTFGRLHTDVSDLFESMLTPKVRKEVFGGR